MSGVFNLTAKQINKEVPKKLNLQNIQQRRERYGDYYLDGKYQFRVIMPNIHGGAGKTISRSMHKICRDSVHLNASKFSALVRCPMTGEDFEVIIREKIETGAI